MDALLTIETVLTRRVYDQVADLLNLEIDLLFFEIGGGWADEPVARDEHGRGNPDPAAASTDEVRDVGSATPPCANG